MRSTRVAVCIVSTDEAENLLGVLESLSKSEHSDFSVYICENGGAAALERSRNTLRAATFLKEVPRTEEAFRFRMRDGRQPVVLLNQTRNLGYAGGSNAGIAAARDDGPFDAFWVLNPDTFPEPRALGALIERQREGDFGIVGSRLVFVASGLVQMWGGFSWNDWLAKGREALGFGSPADASVDVAEIERQLDVVSGASMYVSREYVDQIGLMDDEFFVFCEDSDWCLRRGKFQLGYAHDSIVHHIHGSTSGSSMDKRKVSRFNAYLTARNRVLLVRKQFRLSWPFAAMAILVDLHRFLVRGAWKGYSAAISGWVGGVLGRGGPPPFLVQRSAT